MTLFSCLFPPSIILIIELLYRDYVCSFPSLGISSLYIVFISQSHTITPEIPTPNVMSDTPPLTIPQTGGGEPP